MLLPGPLLAPRYVPRQAGSPGDPLHKVVREHLSTLVADAEARDRPFMLLSRRARGLEL